MNTTQPNGGNKPRRGRHPVQMAQSRRHKNAQQRKQNSSQEVPQKVVVVGDARDVLVQGILKEQQAKLGVTPEDKLTFREAIMAILQGMFEGLKEELSYPKKKEKRNFFDM